ncbi:hypothetical protein NM688_g3149 [Phlebia brevispora]|uniref:Uncharacterized protein n=1 Tax=Phlebia brevispora TaxID=194682 RepID=A0ACC1T6I2_9APHY|nr:hypothetical protein NM688_g3149 [Phlebia brevispora]
MDFREDRKRMKAYKPGLVLSFVPVVELLFTPLFACFSPTRFLSRSTQAHLPSGSQEGMDTSLFVSYRPEAVRATNEGCSYDNDANMDWYSTPDAPYWQSIPTSSGPSGMVVDDTNNHGDVNTMSSISLEPEQACYMAPSILEQPQGDNLEAFAQWGADNREGTDYHTGNQSFGTAGCIKPLPQTIGPRASLNDGQDECLAYSTSVQAYTASMSAVQSPQSPWNAFLAHVYGSTTVARLDDRPQSLIPKVPVGQMGSMYPLPLAVDRPTPGEYIPQQITAGHLQSRRDRDLSIIATFTRDNGVLGIPLHLVLRNTVNVDYCQDTTLYQGLALGQKVHYRIFWPGYKEYARHKYAQRRTGYITRAQIVRQVAEVTRKFFDEHERVQMRNGYERWRVGKGGIRFEDIELVGLRRVLHAGVQPVFRYRH